MPREKQPLDTIAEPELWTRFENRMLNEGVTQRRVEKLKSMYQAVQRGIRTPLSKANREDVEDFINRLNRDLYKRQNKQSFSGSTKADIKKFLRQFFKWYKGEDEFFPSEVRWIKARISKDERPEEKQIVTIEEVKRVISHFDKGEFRILTLILFDSGFRIGEILSAKKKDLTFEPYDEQNKCFWISCNESKTIKRKVDIPLFTEDLKTFCNSAYFENKAPDDLLFDGIEYHTYLTSLNNAAKKVLGKNKHLSPHCLRHSSATYYAKAYDGNMNMLAERYGWTYSSGQLRTYIRRSGAYQKQGAKKVFTNQVVKVEEENRELKEQMQKLQEQMQRQQEMMQAFFDGKLSEAKKKYESLKRQ